MGVVEVGLANCSGNFEQLLDSASCFASAQVVDLILASPRDLKGSDQTGTAILCDPDEYG